MENPVGGIGPPELGEGLVRDQRRVPLVAISEIEQDDAEAGFHQTGRRVHAARP